MKNLYLDFRLCGFLVKRIFIFDKTTYIDTTRLPYKNNSQFDLKITLKNNLELFSVNSFFIFNSLRTRFISTKEDIFFNYKEYTVYINNFNTENIFNDNKIIYKSKLMSECIESVKKISRSTENILIYGETGVGKELIANLVHFNSFNNSGPFIVLNSALFKEDYDLLGLKKGAFTNGIKNLKSVFERAKKGILVIDNFDELDLKSQALLLRIVENKVIKNLGSDNSKKINIRVIAITNQNPYKLVDNFKIRKDLFYRLASYVIKVPSLIERYDDLSLIIEYFLGTYKITYRAMNILKTKYYDGNVRELANLIFKLKVNSNNKVIDISSFDNNISYLSCLL